MTRKALQVGFSIGVLVVLIARTEGAEPVPVYSLYEKFVELEPFESPYDTRQVAVDAVIACPDGVEKRLPLFYDGENGWGLRYAPDKPGQHTVQIELRKNGGEPELVQTVDFAAEDRGGRGFIRVSPENPRYFAYDNGESFFPLGENMGWVNPIERWPEYLGRLGETGANWIRIWMGTWGLLALEWDENHRSGVYHGLRAYSLENARRLDEILREAEARGLTIQLVFNNHGQFSIETNPEWNSNPYNTANGGFLESPEQFFTHPESLQRYRDRLRYLVARYGWSTSLFAWELWNEVNLTHNYDFETVAAWHAEMAQELKRLDPYRHPVTSSGSGGALQHHRFEEMDFLQTHVYLPEIIGVNLSGGRRMLQERPNQPHFFGEMGTEWRGPQNDDESGFSLHDMLWSSIHSGASGTAMTWWWDNWVDPRNLYDHFRDAAAYVEGIHWVCEDIMTITVDMESPEIGDRPLVWSGLAGWGPSSTDRFEIAADGTISNMEACPEFIQGTNHMELRSKPRFLFEALGEGWFEVRVEKIARSGAAIRVLLDGEEVLRRTFSAAGADYTLGEAGVFRVPFSAGTHEIQVSNPGKDWFRVEEYRLLGVSHRLLLAGLAGEGLALVWLKDRNAFWNLVKDGSDPGETSPVDIRVNGLPGSDREDVEWAFERWDTWTGTVKEAGRVRARAGSATLRVPAFRRDVAYKLRRLGSPAPCDENHQGVSSAGPTDYWTSLDKRENR